MAIVIVGIKNEQLKEKDNQIRKLLERDRETHILIQQLQGVLALAAPASDEKNQPKTSFYDLARDARKDESPDDLHEAEEEGERPADEDASGVSIDEPPASNAQ